MSPFATLAGIPNIALPGRNVTVNNNPLPYNWNQATNADGISVVYMNCLQCHAGQFNGKLVIGLGNVDADWTQNLGNAAWARPTCSDCSARRRRSRQSSTSSSAA